MPVPAPLFLALVPLAQVAERALDPSSGRTYVRSAEPLTFFDADLLARLAGGALVSLTSEEEETFVLDNFGAEEGYWLGLEFPREAWSTGEPYVFTRWFHGEPNGGVREPFTVLNFGEPGAWGDISGDAEKELYRALVEFAPGRAPAELPALPPRPTNRGVLLLAVQDLGVRDLENTRLPNLRELWKRAAWTADAAAESDPLASLGMLVWGVGSARSRLALERPQDAARENHESLLARLERGLSRVSTAALLDDPSASGILMDGRVDLRVTNASARKGGSARAVADALALPAPLCIVAAWTSLAGPGAEPASPTRRAQELAAIDEELGELLTALRARPEFSAEDWWIALAGLVPPDSKPLSSKATPEEMRAHSAVPLGIVASACPAGELLCEVALVDLVPSALAHLGLEPRRSSGLDGRALAPVRAQALGVDLVENGSAEEQFDYPTSDSAHFTGWRHVRGFRRSVHVEGLAGDPGPAARGGSFFLGSAGARLEQTIDLSALATEIDRGALRYELSALLGVVEDSPSSLELVLECLTEKKKALASETLAPAEPGKKDQGLHRAGCTRLALEGRLPRRTRLVRVALVASGSGTMADEVRFVLRRD